MDYIYKLCYNITMHEVNIEILKNPSLQDIEKIAFLASQLSVRYTPEETKRLVPEVIKSENSDILVARENSKQIIGMAVLSLVNKLDSKAAYLSSFVVERPFQNQGVGSQLWKGLLSWGNQHQATKIFFECDSNREEAIKFYKNKGAIQKKVASYVLNI